MTRMLHGPKAGNINRGTLRPPVRLRLRPRINATLKTDPTRTTALRRRFMQQMGRRFNDLKRDIRISIVDNDCFGIQPGLLGLSPTARKIYAFLRTEEKVNRFMAWLREQERLGILQIVTRPSIHRGTEGPWTDAFIDSRS